MGPSKSEATRYPRRTRSQPLTVSLPSMKATSRPRPQRIWSFPPPRAKTRSRPRPPYTQSSPPRGRILSRPPLPRSRSERRCRAESRPWERLGRRADVQALPQRARLRHSGSSADSGRIDPRGCERAARSKAEEIANPAEAAATRSPLAFLFRRTLASTDDLSIGWPNLTFIGAVGVAGLAVGRIRLVIGDPRVARSAARRCGRRRRPRRRARACTPRRPSGRRCRRGCGRSRRARRVSRAAASVPDAGARRLAGVVDDRPEERERAVVVVEELQQARLLRPVGLGGDPDAPEAAAVAAGVGRRRR